MNVREVGFNPTLNMHEDEDLLKRIEGENFVKRENLESTAKAMVADGKGILAADESVGTITKRFDTLKIKSTEESRRTYRELLLTAPGVSEFLSGVILYDETIRQKDSKGNTLS